MTKDDGNVKAARNCMCVSTAGVMGTASRGWVDVQADVAMSFPLLHSLTLQALLLQLTLPMDPACNDW